MNPMARWGDKGRFEGRDVDTIGEPGMEGHKMALMRSVSIVIIERKRKGGTSVTTEDAE
jgi:hypothetical protein